MNHLCERLVEAVIYLQREGLTLEQLRSLHHTQRRPETFASTCKYFAKKRELKTLNVAYAERLIFVANEHKQHCTPIKVSIAAAIARWPL